jgi:hypothetical protein
LQQDVITVHAGDNITGIDIILNKTPGRFDDNEDSGALFDPPMQDALAGDMEVSA